MFNAFNKEILLELLKYEKFVNEVFQQDLEYYNQEKYFELENQLRYIKDYIIWKKSFPKYFKLFTDFKNQLINDETFLDSFFDLYNEDKLFIQNEFNNDLLRNFAENSKDFENLVINPKSLHVGIFLEDLGVKLELLDDGISINENYEETVHSYIKKIYPVIESFK